MKVLIATTKTQGDRPDDLFTAVPGELVMLGFVCDRDMRDPERGCGCSRVFAGASSSRSTTSAEVIEMDTTEADVIAAFDSALTRMGWEPGGGEEAALEMLELADVHPVGTVLGRYFDDVTPRA